MALLAFVSGLCSLQDECGLILIFLCFRKHRYIDILQYLSGCHVLTIWLNFLPLNTARAFAMAELKIWYL